MDKQIEQHQQNNTFQLILKETPLAEPKYHTVNAGITVATILEKAPKVYDQPPWVYVNGVQSDATKEIIAGDIVEVVYVPQGNLVESGLFGLAAFLGFKLFRPPRMDGSEAEQFERFRRLRNEERPYQTVPTLLGKRKVAPYYIARPYTMLEGDAEWFYALMSTGYGPQQIENFRLGSNPLSEFEHEITVLDNFTNFNPQAVYQAYSADISQENVDVTLQSPDWLGNNNGDIQYNTRSLDGNVNEVVMDFLWPAGAFRITRSKGRTQAFESGARVDYVQDGVRTTLVAIRPAGTSHIYGTAINVGGSWFLDFGSGGQVALQTVGQPRNGVIKAINVPTNRLVTSIFHSSADRKAKAKSLNFLTDSDSPIIVHVGKTFPANDIRDELNPTDTMQWLNVKVKRPLTFQQFDEAIGSKRPFLRYEGAPSGGVRTYRPTIIALKIKATGQLSGQLDNLFCDATMCVPVNKTADWRNWPNLALEPSTNPADAYKWLLQGPMNYSPVPIEKIDHANLQTWRNRCIAENYTLSAWIDYESTLLAELRNVAFTGRADFSFKEGKFGVVEKIERTLPVQMFTNKNSANFQSSRSYPEEVDGIKFEFDSLEIDYEKDEGTFLDPIKAANPDRLRGRFQRMTLWGIDNFDQAYRMARFQYYEEFLQRELYTLETDIEAIRCTRGDLVYVQNDVILAGLGAGRILAVTPTSVLIDEEVGLEDTTDPLAIMFRMSDGSFQVEQATYNGNREWSVDVPAGVKVGDLVSYGVADRVILPCYIQDIQYNQDMGARVTLRNAISYDFDDEPIPEYIPSITLPPVNEIPDAPIIYDTPSVDPDRGLVTLTILNLDTVRLQGLVYNVQYRHYETELGQAAATEWETLGVAIGQSLEVSVPNLIQGQTYQFRVQARRDNSTFSAWSNIATVELDFGSEPSEIENLGFQHTLDGTMLLWNRIDGPFVDGFEIRLNTNFGDDNDEANLVGFTKNLSWNVGYLDQDVTYYIAVKSIYARYSDHVQINVTKPVVNIPTGLQLIQDIPPSFTWVAPTPIYRISYYNVYREGTPYAQLDGTRIEALVAESGEYTFSVEAVDLAGNISDLASITDFLENARDFFTELLSESPIFDEIVDELRDSVTDIRDKITNVRDQLVEDVNQILDDMDESIARETGIRQVTQIIENETENRVTQINLVQSALDDEVATRTAQILQVNQAITNESLARATAISQVNARINTAETNINANSTLIQNAQVDINGNASAISALQSFVGSSDVGMALSDLLLSAELDANGNTKATAALGTRVDNLDDDFAEANLLLESAIAPDGTVIGKGALTVNANNQVTGIVLQAGQSGSIIELQAGRIRFLDPSGNIKIAYSTTDGEYVYDGNITCNQLTTRPDGFIRTGLASDTHTRVVLGTSSLLPTSNAIFVGQGAISDANAVFRINRNGDALYRGKMEIVRSNNTLAIDPDNDLMMWFGPNTSAGSKSKSNGTFWIASDGSYRANNRLSSHPNTLFVGSSSVNQWTQFNLVTSSVSGLARVEFVGDFVSVNGDSFNDDTTVEVEIQLRDGTTVIASTVAKLRSPWGVGALEPPGTQEGWTACPSLVAFRDVSGLGYNQSKTYNLRIRHTTSGVTSFAVYGRFIVDERQIL